MNAAAYLLAVVTPGTSPTAQPLQPFGANVITFSFLLSTLVWVPVLAALIVAAWPNQKGRHSRTLYLIAFWTNVGLLLLCLIAYNQANLFSPNPQFEENLSWVPSIGARYHLSADGVTIVMLLLSALIGTVAVLASNGIRERVREYMALLLLVQASVNGVLVAHDGFVLILFWWAGVVPVTLLLAGWGGPRRAAAAARFVGYSAVGGAALVLAVLVLYANGGGAGFDFDILFKSLLSPRIQLVVAVLVVVAAATRLPLVPFHGWVLDALAEAPVGVAVVVAGVLTRLGGYVLIRLLVIGLHDGSRLVAPLVAVLAGLTVVYAALACFRTDDIRRLGAYAALIPGGVFALGIAGLTPVALLGSCLQLLAGGLAAALVVGAVATVAERSQVRSMSLMGGLATRMPKLAWLLILAALSLLGVPGTLGFLAAVLTLFGSFYNQPGASFVVALGLVALAVAMAVSLQRILFGQPRPDAPGASDASLSEAWFLGVLVAAVIYFGVLPGGPKLGGAVTLFDQGVVNVLNNSTSDFAAVYAPPDRTQPATPTQGPLPTAPPAGNPVATPSAP